MPEILSHEDQIYLLFYWMRTNLVNFDPTIKNIKEQLFTEFNISSPVEPIAEEIRQLFMESA